MKPKWVMRRDANEPEVVASLRAQGWMVWPITGKGVPDLLVWALGRYSVVEVKHPKKGALTESQRRWWALADGEKAPAFQVTSGEQAVQMIRNWRPVYERFDTTDVEMDA